MTIGARVVKESSDSGVELEQAAESVATSPFWKLTPVFPEWQGKAGFETERPRFPNRTTGGNGSRALTRKRNVTLPRPTAADARKALIPGADANLATNTHSN